MNYIDILFNQDEFIWSGNRYWDTAGSRDRQGTTEYLTEVLPNATAHGLSVALNPATQINAFRGGVNVKIFRNLLIECDDSVLTKEQQFALISGVMPFSTATWSGGKSVHFILSLEEPLTWDNYRLLHSRLVVGLRKYGITVDAQTNNPCQWTKVPQGNRLHIDGSTHRQASIAMIGRLSNDRIQSFLDATSLYWYCSPEYRKYLSSSEPKATRPKSSGSKKAALLNYWLALNNIDWAGEKTYIACPYCRDCGEDRKGTNMLIVENEEKGIYLECMKGCDFGDIWNALIEVSL